MLYISSYGLKQGKPSQKWSYHQQKQGISLPAPFKWMRAAFLLCSIAVLLYGGTNALAQEFRGTISGKVTDASGAVVPGASVTMTKTQTAAVSKTVSDGSGEYVVPFLAPGSYKIAVESTGFEQTVRTGIALESGQHAIIDLVLKVGSASQTVRVSEQAPLINTANASIGQVITTKEVADLPLNGRTPMMLAELSIGVLATSQPSQVHPFDNNAAAAWSIGGAPAQTSEILLDGAPDEMWSGALAYSPPEDAVQEVTVRAFDTDAAFGHTQAGVINQVLKSGTNSLHGSLYEFGQASVFDANTYFNDRTNTRSW